MASGVEHNDGKSMSVGDGSAEAQRRFLLEGYANELLVLRNAFGSTITKTGSGIDTVAIPKLRDPHDQFSRLFAYKYDLRCLPGTKDSWEAVFYYRKYQPTGLVDTSGLSMGPETVGYQEVSARCSGSFHDVYRANPNLPSNGIPNEADIGGEGVDAGGVPTSIMRQQYEISFATTDNSGSLKTYGEAVGHRCEGTPFGLPGAAVLYRGANITRIGTNLFNIQHTYLYDDLYHLIQAPDYHPDGRPNIDYETGKFRTVRFVQPFPQGSPDPGQFVPSGI